MLSAVPRLIKGHAVQKLTRTLSYFTFWVILSLVSISCTEKEFDPNDPAKSFAIAREPYDDRNWEIALQKLGEFKSRFPYSKFATTAELFIANSHFELEQFEESAVAYSQFVKLHPKNENVDYAMFRVGESYWVEAPEDVDREQDYTIKAIDEWKKLITRLPDSPYAKKAQDLMEKGQRRLAGSNQFIADFYCKQEIWHACAFRNELLLEKYPQYKELHEKARLQAAKAFEKLAALKREDPESDKNIYFKTMTAEQLEAKAKQLRSEKTN